MRSGREQASDFNQGDSQFSGFLGQAGECDCRPYLLSGDDTGAGAAQRYYLERRQEVRILDSRDRPLGGMCSGAVSPPKQFEQKEA